MRIISGKYRSKRIQAPKSIKARPTTDFAKESLFNILCSRYDLDQIQVLDLFSGTGNISYEFGSRGAKSIVAVDISRASYKFISSMSSELMLPMNVVQDDVFRFLSKTAGNFDIIFADPPYRHEKMLEIPQVIFTQNLLKPNGVLIVEHDKLTDFTKEERFLELRQYGKVNFSFFE